MIASLLGLAAAVAAAAPVPPLPKDIHASSLSRLELVERSKLSPEGQRDVVLAGAFLPLDSDTVPVQRRALD